MENAGLGDPNVPSQKCVWHGEREVMKGESEPQKPSSKTLLYSGKILLSSLWFSNCGCVPGGTCTAIDCPISPGTRVKAECRNMMTERLDTGAGNCMSLRRMIQTGNKSMSLDVFKQ